ncbi:hypothetical protein MIT9_P0313 [Methylomarinovum caldicuralii]|uniref:Tetratricopeptide repeat protein n=2 Tax=Methylomarinovum caldicuralii TaxID=438856 RepID=A0AAU9CS46_9GAMM|nr:hypothetical protein MIT9_P0313 [Methylomarinovum caldicuralii]
MKPVSMLRTALLVLLLAVPLQGFAVAADRIGARWDEITYHWPKARREAGLTRLLAEIRALRQQQPDQADLLIWEAIVTVSRASLSPNLSVLGQLQQTRKLLERAIALDPRALDGAAYLTLACLYYKLPGWPLSFGDRDKAEIYFRKALALNPDGIETHYYYARYLHDRGETAAAQAHFEKVLQLSGDPDQPYLAQRLKRKAAQKLGRLLASRS